MVAPGYPDSREPCHSGSSAPDAEALGTDWSAGRTRSVNPSKPSGSDASTERFALTYYDPPEGLERHILTLFHFQFDEPQLMDRHPGALGQLFLSPRGSGAVRFGDRTDHFEPGAHMFSGFETAAPFHVDGPWHVIGASLSALGWAALAGAPASTHVDRLLPARELLGEEIDAFAHGLNAAYNAGKVSGEAACSALAEWIAPRLSPVPDPHRAFIGQVLAWLGSSLHPDVEALFGPLDYSRRQAERLVERYFGFTPAALARRFRAIRAANLLAQPDLSDEAEAEIAAAFYDQPHMIREIRRYCGYTPTRLGGESEPIFQTLLRMRNLDRLDQFRTIGEQRDTA